MLEKRIKRQVIARTHAFFASASPGLEKLCSSQLRKMGIQNIQVQEGGCAFEGKMTDLYTACLWLSVANRILMRISEFKATNFTTLEKAAAKIPWELYLPAGCELNVRTTAHSSRLYHSDAVSERIIEAITDRLARKGEAPKQSPSLPQQIFVRAVSDHFIISIDASGQLLHMRGLTGGKGKAPLRETLASAILHFARYDGMTPLMDPMCGTGTFSMEAALIAGNIPPGWFRDFAFFSWPAFREPQWHYLRRECQKKIRQTDEPMIFASDLDQKACANLKKQAAIHGMDNMISVARQDFFQTTPSDSIEEPGLIVINPPYGLRMGNRAQAEKLFIKMNNHLAQNFKGWKAAILVPKKAWTSHLRFSAKAQKRQISHGGLKIPLMIGQF